MRQAFGYPARAMSQLSPNVQEVATGIYAYLQPDGSWGLSNSGLILADNEQLLVDTLFDLELTRCMLMSLRNQAGFRDELSIVVNTHANGDHCYGNAALAHRRIIASKRTVREMHEMPARKLASLCSAARWVTKHGAIAGGLKRIVRALKLQFGVDFIDAAPYVVDAFSRFNFEGISTVLPTETFDGKLELNVGGRLVVLQELGPAHTDGDIVAFVPETKTLFAGDLLFEGMHPLVWAGTPRSYETALRALLELDPEVIVPGHGNLCGRASIVEHLDYLAALRAEAEPLYHSAATPEQAAAKLMHSGLGSKHCPERLVVNVRALYRELNGESYRNEVIALFGAMSRLSGRTK